MVVTRRTTIPMPPASRTTSTQETPKVNKGKIPQRSSLAYVDDEMFSHGNMLSGDAHVGPQDFDEVLFSDGSPPRKAVKDRTKVKSKRREGKVSTRRKKRPASWLDLLSRMFILAFLIYSLSVCPTADKQKSPVCRALSEYRRLVLEPYVITPVHQLLLHPSVSPYTTPVIERAQPVIVYAQQEWSSRIVPLWNAHVVPQWEKNVVPSWHAHVSPHLSKLDARVHPYRQQAIEIYGQYAVPYVRHCQALAHKMQPFILLAAAKTHDSYQASKPYLARIYSELQRIPPIIIEYVIRPLVSARRQYVDPHVTVLLEKMQELSSGATKSNVASSNETVSSSIVIETVTRKADGAEKSVGVELPVVSESSGADATLASASSIALASLSLEKDTGNPLPTTELADKSETLASASSVASASLILGNKATESVPGATYSPTPQSKHEPEVLPGQAEESESEKKVRPKSVHFGDHSDVHETVDAQDIETQTLKVPHPDSASMEQTPSSFPDVGTDSVGNIPPVRNDDAGTASQEAVSVHISVPKAHSPPQPVSSFDSPKKDEDLNELLAELGLDIEETMSGEPPATPSVRDETEEEKAIREAQRKAENAERRRDLEARHAEWERKLSETIKAQKLALKDVLASIRRTGAAELKINLAIRTAIETLNSEAEKALRGTDAYFAKLRTGGKPLAEQARLWDRILEKVQAKFDERVREVEETINKWYHEEVLSKEMQEFEKASVAVQTVADDAQTDIGLDYAWLDDVTYLDWRRYHALPEKHKEFVDEQLSLANGSHPNAYPNPVLDAFEDIQSEVQDITLGFETRIRRIKREGERAFAEQRSQTEVSAPEVSVLPVVDNGGKEDKAFQEVADAILGRSEEEVAEAFSRAEEQEVEPPRDEL